MISTYKFLGLYLPITTYNGFCLDPQFDKDIIGFIPTTEVYECYQKCKTTHDCKAFAFNDKTTIGLSNCYLYRNGPYTQGTGASEVICYVLQGIEKLSVYFEETIIKEKSSII